MVTKRELGKRWILLVATIIITLLLTQNATAENGTYRVQNGFHNITGTEVFIPLNHTLKNTSRAFVIAPNMMSQEFVAAGTGGDPAANDQNSRVSLYVFNTTHLRAQRNSSSDGTFAVTWQVLETLNGAFTVQRGEHLQAGTAAATNFQIPNTVNRSNAMTWFTYRTSYTGNNGDKIQWYSNLTNGTNFLLTREHTGTSTSIFFRWTVIEWNRTFIDYFDKGYTGAITGGDGSPNCFATSQTFNKDSSFLFHHSHAISDSDGGLDSSARAGYINNNTHVCFYDYDGGFTAGVKWFLIDFAGTTVRDEDTHTAWGSTDYIDNPTLSGFFKLSRTLLWVSGTSNGDGTAKPRHTQWWYLQDNGTAHTGIQIQRSYGGQAREYAWYALQIPGPNPPRVNLSFPWINYTNNSEPANFTFNATVQGDLDIVNCSLWHNSTGSWHLNTTQIMTGTNNITNLTSGNFTNTEFVWNIQCYDEEANHSFATENRTVRIDSINPGLTIAQPEAINYSTNSLSFNISGNENLDHCLFSLTSFATNYTMNKHNNTFYYYINNSVNEGLDTAEFWCNDTAGNINNTESITFQVDLTAPLINFVFNTLAAGSYAQTFIWANVTASDNVFLDTIRILIYNSTHLYNSSSSSTSPYFDNFTNFPEGTYYLNASANDTAGNTNETETRTIILDFSAPQLSIIYPLNISYGANVTQMNYTVSDPSLDTCWYSLDGGLTNTSHSTCNGTIDDITSYIGTHNWTVYANDTLGNFNSSVIFFTINSDVPVVTIQHPDQGTNYTVNVSLNYTAVDPELSDCWYNIDNGANISLASCVNVSVLSLTDGQHNVTVWANDTNGNYAFDTKDFGIDLNAPNVTSTAPDNNTITNEANINFTSNNNDSVGLENTTLYIYNSTGLYNQTTATLTGLVAPAAIVVNLIDGIYTWFYRTFDLFGNFANSQNRTITIDTELPIVNLSSPNGTTIENTVYLAGNFSDTTGLQNATLYVWNATNSTVIQQTVSISGTSNNTNLTATPNDPGTYTWNYLVCDQATNCAWNATNYTFTYSPWISYTSNYQIIGEWGNISDINESDWVYVRFNHTFNNTPVVVHYGDFDYDYDNNPCGTRIANVTTQGFEIRAEAWSDSGSCTTGGSFNAFWLAAEKGIHNVSNNGVPVRTIEVDNFTMSNAACGTGAPTSDWTFDANHRLFNNTWSTQPLVLAGVQTVNDFDVINYYIRACDTTNGNTWNTTCVEIGMNGLENDDASVPVNQPCNDHGSNEEGGYIAWEMNASWSDAETRDNFGNISDGNLAYEWEAFWESDNVAGLGNDAFPLSAYSVTLLRNYDEGAAFSSGIRVDGGDGLFGGQDFDAGTNQIFFGAVEDYFGDTDTAHTAEPWQALFFGSGRGFLFSDQLSSSLTITLNQPVQNFNSTAATLNITFNATVTSNNNLINCSLWHNATDAWHLNQTLNVTGTANVTNFTLTNLSNVNFIWNVECTDNTPVTLFATENYSVNIDNTNPEITIVQPQTINYSTTAISFNASGNEHLTNCLVSLDNFATNYTMTALNNTFFYYINSSVNVGYHTAAFWCTDYVGNHNNTETVDFGVDNVTPTISLVAPTLTEGNYSQNNILVNASAADIGLGIDTLTVYLYNTTHLVNTSINNSSPNYINFTNLADGTYYINASVNDTANNINTTETREILLDTTNPTITFLFPLNQTYGFNVTYLQTTISDVNLDTCWYSNNTGTTNTTYNCSLAVGLFQPDGSHNFQVWANDTAGNLGFQQVYFSVSTSIPTIQIYIPANGANYTTNIGLNYTAEDPELDSCWYNIDTGTNISLASCTNLTNLSVGEGTHTVTVWANDTNENNASITHTFWMDRIIPDINVLRPEARGYADFENVPFRVNSSESLSYCHVSFDDWTTNYTMTKDNNTHFSYDNNSLPYQSFTARYWCNDTTGNINSTSTVDFYVNPPSLNITMLYPTQDMNVTQDAWFNVTVNVTCLGSTCGDTNVTLDPLQWWNLSWKKRKQINITNVGTEDLNNYPLYLNISRETEMNNDYGDLRFINGTCLDGQITELDYELENYTTTYAEVWVELLSIPGNGETSICLYYNNSAATSTTATTTVWNSDFGIVYHMNNTGDDSTSNNRDRISTTGTPIQTHDDLGEGMYFDGINDAWTQTNLAYWEAGWDVRMHEIIFDTSTDVTSRQTLFAEGGGTNGILMYIINGYLYARWWSESDGWFGDHINTSVTANTRYHAVMGLTEGTTSDEYFLFVNGELIDNRTATTGIFSHTGDGGIAYPNAAKDYHDLNSSSGSFFNGTIYEFRTMDAEQPYNWYNQTYQTIFNSNNYVTVGSELIQGINKGIIPTTIGATPFYTNKSTNPFTINLGANESQTVTFWVNASGEPDPYVFFAYANVTGDPIKSGITDPKLILEIRDLTAPIIEFLAPTKVNDSNETDDFVRAFVRVTERNELNISFDLYWQNHTLYRQNTSTTGLRDVTWPDVPDGTYHYNVTVWDQYGNVGSSETRTINLDSTAPTLTIISLEDNTNITGYNASRFSYNTTDTHNINCSLYGNWSGSWHLNQSQTPTQTAQDNYTDINTSADGFYWWFISCTDSFGNTNQSNNRTFSTFNPVEDFNELSFNISQNNNTGDGNVILTWNHVNHTYQYKVLYTNNLTQNFTVLTTTTATTYTDTTANSERRRFYKIRATNPISQNLSDNILGKTVYYLQRVDSVGTRNWINLYPHNKNITTANDTLNDLENLTTINYWNATIQQRVTCNRFSCPTGAFCTDTNCNFNITEGYGYETNINASTSQTQVNWSFVGEIQNATNLTLIKNTTSFGKNWISTHANSTLQNGTDILTNITNADAISQWNETTQTSQGIIPNPFPWIPTTHLGHFSIEPEKGYETSITANTNWTQQ